MLDTDYNLKKYEWGMIIINIKHAFHALFQVSELIESSRMESIPCSWNGEWHLLPKLWQVSLSFGEFSGKHIFGQTHTGPIGIRWDMSQSDQLNWIVYLS